MGAVGDFIGGVVDAVGGLFGGTSDAVKAQQAALEAQAKAQEAAMKMQQQQAQRNMAMQQQQMNKANADMAQASAAFNNTPTVTNPSNLTGGLGVNPDELLLGQTSLLGEKDKKRSML